MKINLKFSLTLLLTAMMLLPLTADARKGKQPKAACVRLLNYNIADGMWYDQYNNYDRFVDWVQNQGSDVFAISEGATHWNEHKKTVSAELMPRYLPDSLGVLAARWGHPYTMQGTYQDNYPVAFTSKYPIQMVQRIDGPRMSHGALHVKINGVNYVVLHLWPQRFSMGDKSRSDNGGDAFRLQEMRQILDSTILNPRFAQEKHWLMMGDFNTLSPVDSTHYKKPRNYDVHRAVRAAYPHDVIADKYPGQFIPSVARGGSRIDYIYCTSEVMQGLLRAETIKDAFTLLASDHLPLLIEFRAPKR